METVRALFVFIVSLCLCISCNASETNNETLTNSTEINSEPVELKSEAETFSERDELHSDIKMVNSDTNGLNSDTNGLNSDTNGLNSDTDGLHSDTDGLNSETDGVNSDTVEVNSDSLEVISDTGDQTLDAKDLTPEDEDMVIQKISDLGGLLDAKDIAEITAEVEATEEDEDIPEDAEDLKFEPIPMPTDFDSYDRDGDGFIEMDELIQVTGAFENVEQAFKVCDTNDDGTIDREEFKVAPWDLSGKPPEGGREQL